MNTNTDPALTFHNDNGTHYARCEDAAHGIYGWTSFSVHTRDMAEFLAAEHLAAHAAGRWAAPTADAKLVRTNGRVSVVRCQEAGELPVWTVHVHGERPIYVALSLRDADRVADHWASVPLAAALAPENYSR